MRLSMPLFPACTSSAEPKVQAYWGRPALREAVLAALVTTLLTSAVQAAPQLFSQSPAASFQQIKSLVLLGPDNAAQPRLLDCP